MTDPCQSCGRNNPVWFADNEVWNEIVPGRVGFICPICFIEQAERQGFKCTGWKLTPAIDKNNHLAYVGSEALVAAEQKLLDEIYAETTPSRTADDLYRLWRGKAIVLEAENTKLRQDRDIADSFLEVERNHHKVSIMEWQKVEAENTRLRTVCDLNDIDYDKLAEERDRLQGRIEQLEKELTSVISESWYVLSGGDNPSDKCPSCGIAGYGELRSKLKLAEKALAERGGS